MKGEVSEGGGELGAVSEGGRMRYCAMFRFFILFPNLTSEFQ